MRKYLFPLLLLPILLSAIDLFAQTDIIEIDSLTRSAVRSGPFDKPFLIKSQIDAETITNVFIIKKHKKKNLDETLAYYSDQNQGNYQVPQLEKQYFWTRKIGDKNYLFISITDKHLFKPSESYFIIPDLRQTDASVVSFFDAFYQSVLPIPTAATELLKARAHLAKFETGRRKIFGDSLDFGFMTVQIFNDSIVRFGTDFTSHLRTPYQRYELSKTIFVKGLPQRVTTINANLPSFDSLTYAQLFTDTAINKEALSYLGGKEMQKNDVISDFSTIQAIGKLSRLISGSSGLNCIYCDTVDINSNAIKDLSKRMANIDSSIKQINVLQRSLYLLKPKSGATSNISTSISRTNIWITQLQLSKDSIALMVRQRKGIEDIILDSLFAGRMFTYTQVLSGNTYLNFETRNKLLLTPDFGIVLPSFSSQRKNLEYRIIPYLGFHVNLMAVDKDITYKSYRKHPLQRMSLMVGWSLVNLNQDSTYTNFFEKSTLLTGAGFRINNVIRLTAGAQWLFKLNNMENASPSRKLTAIPYLGLSFDLNIKQYLNGFVDLLSGIGKTNPTPPKTVTTSSQ